jgi:hypothetical protein
MITPVPSSATSPVDAATTLLVVVDAAPPSVVVVVGAVVETRLTLLVDVPPLVPIVDDVVGEVGVDPTVPGGVRGVTPVVVLVISVQNTLVHFAVMTVVNGPQELRTPSTVTPERGAAAEQSRSTSGTGSRAQTHQDFAVRLFRVS